MDRVGIQSRIEGKPKNMDLFTFGLLRATINHDRFLHPAKKLLADLSEKKRIHSAQVLISNDRLTVQLDTFLGEDRLISARVLREDLVQLDYYLMNQLVAVKAQRIDDKNIPLIWECTQMTTPNLLTTYPIIIVGNEAIALINIPASTMDRYNSSSLRTSENFDYRNFIDEHGVFISGDLYQEILRRYKLLK